MKLIPCLFLCLLSSACKPDVDSSGLAESTDTKTSDEAMVGDIDFDSMRAVIEEHKRGLAKDIEDLADHLSGKTAFLPTETMYSLYRGTGIIQRSEAFIPVKVDEFRSADNHHKLQNYNWQSDPVYPPQAGWRDDGKTVTWEGIAGIVQPKQYVYFMDLGQKRYFFAPTVLKIQVTLKTRFIYKLVAVGGPTQNLQSTIDVAYRSVVENAMYQVANDLEQSRDFLEQLLPGWGAIQMYRKQGDLTGAIIAGIGDIAFVGGIVVKGTKMVRFAYLMTTLSVASDSAMVGRTAIRAYQGEASLLEQGTATLSLAQILTVAISIKNPKIVSRLKSKIKRNYDVEAIGDQHIASVKPAKLPMLDQLLEKTFGAYGKKIHIKELLGDSFDSNVFVHVDYKGHYSLYVNGQKIHSPGPGRPVTVSPNQVQRAKVGTIYDLGAIDSASRTAMIEAARKNPNYLLGCSYSACRILKQGGIDVGNVSTITPALADQRILGGNVKITNSAGVTAPANVKVYVAGYRKLTTQMVGHGVAEATWGFAASSVSLATYLIIKEVVTAVTPSQSATEKESNIDGETGAQIPEAISSDAEVTMVIQAIPES